VSGLHRAGLPLYALPHLIGPAELRRQLTASGLETELVEDLADAGMS
jgi:hypothetical protein